MRPDQRLDDVRDFRRSALARELEHVAFGDQPVAEIDPLDGEPLALRIDKPRAVGVDEIGRGAARRVATSEHERASAISRRKTKNRSFISGSQDRRRRRGAARSRRVPTGRLPSRKILN